MLVGDTVCESFTFQDHTEEDIWATFPSSKKKNDSDCFDSLFLILNELNYSLSFAMKLK